MIGAVLGTLPDLDVFIDYGDAVKNFTYHRGFTHSLFVLTPLALLIWLALRNAWSVTAEHPLRWLLAILLALLTHPLLDALTAYGTQLFWPLQTPPVMVGAVFIIDPLYSLPLLVAVLYAALARRSRRSGLLLRGALAISTAYLGWALVAQTIVTRHAKVALAETRLPGAPVFVTPTPFNTLLWRVVARTPGGYLEGFDSLLVNEGPMAFTSYPVDQTALQAAGNIGAVARLRWFSNDFVTAEVVADRLVIRDLRMGQEPVYVFSHAVAERDGAGWRAIPPELLPVSFEDRRLSEVWQRIWHSPH